MSDFAPGATYQLDIDPSPESLSTARLFVAAAARVLGVESDTIDDLRLVVSEAITAAITRGAADRVIVEIDPSRPSLMVSPLTPQDLPPESDAHSIISALFGQIEHESSGRMVVVFGRSNGDTRSA